MKESQEKIDASELRLEKGDRDEKGRFRKGCTPGPGNPLARRTHQLRIQLLKAATREEIAKIARQLVKDAQSDKFAIRHPSRHELLNRLFGKNNVLADADEQAQAGAVNLAVILADPRMLEQVNSLALQLANSGNGDKLTGRSRSVVSQEVEQDAPPRTSS